MAFAATVPDNPWQEMLAEREELRVLVVPTGENETKENRHQVLLEPQIELIFCKPIKDAGDRKKLSELVRAVRISLRFVKQADSSGRLWVWKSTETVAKFDAELIRKGQYVASIRLTYIGIE